MKTNPKSEIRNPKSIVVAPSLLSADFRNLEEQIRFVEKGGADWLHLDIMDGHFVPNITFGPMLVKTVRSISQLPLDTHLMVEKPERFIEAFKQAGSDILTVHIETCPHLHRTIQQIKSLGMKAGVSLNPSTPTHSLDEIIEDVDLILVMTVNPGFGGQKFIPSMLKKVEEIRSMMTSAEQFLEVDGGVDVTIVAELMKAGANVLVAGKAIFSQKDITRAVKILKNITSKNT
ncbi:MAG: ribulose-phosphate 3-epimerase [Ignavibacteriae bacterium]|nr:ribulose-phosphate 3-epimerase [Ignavibacteriota bacterium]